MTETLPRIAPLCDGDEFMLTRESEDRDEEESGREPPSEIDRI